MPVSGPPIMAMATAMNWICTAGFRGAIGEIPFDVGIIMYQYPAADTGDDAIEIYGLFDFGLLTATAALTIDKDGTSQDNDL